MPINTTDKEPPLKPLDTPLISTDGTALPVPSTDFLNGLVGLFAKNAQFQALKVGFKFRKTRTDGVPHICTRDFNPRRVNVWTINGKVTRAYRG